MFVANEDLEEIARILSGIERELKGLRAELAALRDVVEAPSQTQLPFPAALAEEQLLDLDQVAAIVRLRKRSLEHYRAKMPDPRVQGCRGRRSLWAWAEIRPWLESTFGRVLPEIYPGC